MTEKPTGLALMREPFGEHLISKLPKPTKKQTDDVKANYKLGIRCIVCGGWHHPQVVHLDYVGHAALTDRLLECDPEWNWKPLATNETGTPTIDGLGGMWIELTVCGISRLGYGDAAGKKGPNAVKEVIGDALRNAAMRFGAALDLWHKGDLRIEGDGEDDTPPFNPEAARDRIISDLEKPETMEALAALFSENGMTINKIKNENGRFYDDIIMAKDKAKTRLSGPTPDENNGQQDDYSAKNY